MAQFFSQFCSLQNLNLHAMCKITYLSKLTCGNN